jgi:hypothetical protein
MQSRIVLSLLAAIALPAVSQPLPSTPLVDYHFDDEDLATGPDTFRIIQSTKGSVQLSSRYRYSGFRSMEIRSIAGDPDFPELQGYIPLQTKGTLTIRFALLLTNAQEPVNIALAGPAHFTKQKNGLAFWLKMDGGTLHHVSNKETLPLVALRPFTWYLVDCTYRIETGRYDLAITEEYQQQPAVSLKDQKNVMDEPGSTLDRYSFVSNPFGNDSSALYYVDDVFIATDADSAPRTFVAPGRRKLFVDLYNDYRRSMQANAVCLPATGMADFGLQAEDTRRLQAEGAFQWLEQTLRSGSNINIPEGLSADAQRRLTSVKTWKRGCAAAALGDREAALKM